jgi:glycolate oxidase iron-sulfur subunit
VLNRLGYTVHVPRNQACCGAIHQHSGALKQAAELAQQNKSVFGGLTTNIVINTASGCGVQLLESGVGLHHKLSLESNNVENVQVLSSITDISQFLVAAEGWENVKILPLPQRVLVHDPCTLRNVLRDQTYPYELISRIPEVQVVPLTGNDQCCGAAGTYFIDQPDIADRLLDDKVSAIIDGEAKYLVTSNIGCSMHITYGLSEKKINIEVLHPVTLLARQMGLEL